MSNLFNGCEHRVNVGYRDCLRAQLRDEGIYDCLKTLLTNGWDVAEKARKVSIALTNKEGLSTSNTDTVATAWIGLCGVAWANYLKVRTAFECVGVSAGLWSHFV